MKIYFEFSFQQGPWGGGNQFLKALRSEFDRLGVCTTTATNADVILFNVTI